MKKLILSLFALSSATSMAFGAAFTIGTDFGPVTGPDERGVLTRNDLSLDGVTITPGPGGRHWRTDGSSAFVFMNIGQTAQDSDVPDGGFGTGTWVATMRGLGNAGGVGGPTLQVGDSISGDALLRNEGAPQNGYFEINIPAGLTIDLVSLEFGFRSGNNEGGRNLAVGTSLTDTIIYSEGGPGRLDDPSTVFANVALTGAEYKGLTDTSFTVYFFGQVGSGAIDFNHVFINGTVVPVPSTFADFEMDFGIGEGKVDDLSPLLRNSPDSFILQDNALRLTTTSGSFNSLAAVASVVNRGATQDFIVESELAFNQFADVRASNVGLVLLGGPHNVPESRFNPNDEDGFYSLSFFPALQDSQVDSLFPGIAPAEDGVTSVISISRGFQGEVLAAARWDGRQPFSESTVLADDFENPSTDNTWQTGAQQGTNSWQIGTPTAGPAPVNGSRVAATNLNGTPPLESNAYLRSPPIHLSNSNAVISFREALNIEGDLDGSGNPLHVAIVSIVNEAGGFILELDRYSGISGGWREQNFTIPSEVLGQTVRVEFRLLTDDWVLSSQFGWMIDDFSVTSVVQDDGAYALKGEANYVDDELQLTFTFTDLENDDYSQSISAPGIANPFTGNLFGIGGRLQGSQLGNPEIDFNFLSMSLDGPGIDPGFSYENWLDVMFPDPADRANPELTDRLATPAGDGVSNLLKYAFGFAPMTPVAGADLPQPSLEGGVLTLTYPERVDAVGIAYQPEKSFDLIDWNSEGIVRLSPTVPDGDFEWVTIQLELNGEDRGFLHIQVIDLQ